MAFLTGKRRTWLTEIFSQRPETLNLTSYPSSFNIINRLIYQNSVKQVDLFSVLHDNNKIFIVLKKDIVLRSLNKKVIWNLNGKFQVLDFFFFSEWLVQVTLVKRGRKQREDSMLTIEFCSHLGGVSPHVYWDLSTKCDARSFPTNTWKANWDILCKLR